MTSDDQHRAIHFLAMLSYIYANHFLSDRIFKEQFFNERQALICFLQNYAHERQGAAQAYKKIALECVNWLFNKKESGSTVPMISDSEVEEAWEKYKEIAKSDFNKIKVNEKRNPLNTDIGILKRMASHSDPVTNIAVFVRDKIECGKTKEAHDFIKSIRGVGEKIASFYLRDIVWLAKIDETKISGAHLHLLQPMDTWLEQALQILEPNIRDKEKLEDKQKKIVDMCREANVSACAFNQGAWFFGSQIAKEYKTFQKAIKDINEAKSLLEQHLKEKEQYVKYLKHILKSLHEGCEGI